MLSSVLNSDAAIEIDRNTTLSINEQLELIKKQLTEIAGDMESNERDHDTLFNSIAEISLRLQLNQTNPGWVTIRRI